MVTAARYSIFLATAALSWLAAACENLDCRAKATCIVPDSGGDGGDSGSGGSAGDSGTGGKDGTGGKGGSGDSGSGGSSGSTGGMAGQGAVAGEGGTAGNAGDDCAHASDGTECNLGGGRGICVNGQCGESSCGDGFADSSEDEDCDARDDNGAEGGNCTADCKWVCTSSSDCAITDCREAGKCQDHACTAGTAKEDGLPCGPNNGQICDSGECIDKPCLEAEDCVDDTECTNESCANKLCVYTEQSSIDWYADCDADDYAADGAQMENVRAADSCAVPKDPPEACANGTWTKVVPKGDNTDCDDQNVSVSPESKWYADCDGDDYAFPLVEGTEIQVSCIKPSQVAGACTGIGTASWTLRRPTDIANFDCDDSTDVVNSGVTAWMETEVPGQINSNVDFDYNCDRVETGRYTVFSTSAAACAEEASPSVNKCATHTGWSVGAVPNCGVSAAFVSCAFVTDACVATTPTTKQSCH